MLGITVAGQNNETDRTRLMSNSEMKIGDLAKLNSGGPVMTIRVINEGDVMCDWFDDTNWKPLHKSFPMESLTKQSATE